MNKLFTIILILIGVQINAQKAQPMDSSNLETPNISNVIEFPSTLNINDVSSKSGENLLEKNMPWVVALIIGILSVFVNFWVSHRLRQSNERNLRVQIESNEKNIARQIESSERSILEQIKSNERNQNKQIETAKESKLLEFKATIATNNRQEWINELRHTLSEYLTYCILITPLPDDATQAKLDNRDEIFRKLSLSKSKLELLMNSEKAEQKELLEKIESILEVIRNNIDKSNKPIPIKDARISAIEAARKLFSIHWNKIKELK